MHDCPNCGEACYCNGDACVLTEEWAYMNCEHHCDCDHYGEWDDLCEEEDEENEWENQND